MIVHSLTPIVNVSDIEACFAWFARLGARAAWLRLPLLAIPPYLREELGIHRLWWTREQRGAPA
jgi:hypothetical protein